MYTPSCLSQNYLLIPQNVYPKMYFSKCLSQTVYPKINTLKMYTANVKTIFLHLNRNEIIKYDPTSQSLNGSSDPNAKAV